MYIDEKVIEKTNAEGKKEKEVVGYTVVDGDKKEEFSNYQDAKIRFIELMARIV